MVGNYFSGYGIYQEIQDSMGKKVEVEGDLKLITHREASVTQSRTVSNYLSKLSLQPENYFRSLDKMLRDLALKHGDMVRV